jgi:hypothetical protein
MASEGDPRASKLVEGWLRDYGLKKDRDKVAKQSPRAGPGQAASAQRGESSNSPISGSRRRIIRR